MILKGLLGKIHRLGRGRLAGFRGMGVEGKIADSCLHPYAIHEDSEPAQGDQPPLIIFYSGDGGWANLTTAVSERLQKRGLPVVGIDCMHYFWSLKEAGTAADELVKLITCYSKKWNTSGILLLGYSMGADVLPCIVRELPDEISKEIRGVVLMSPSHRVELRFRFVGWLGFQTPKNAGRPVLPDVKFLADKFPIAFFAGEKERDSLVTEMPGEIAEVELLAGGHHYASDYQLLATKIITKIGKW